MGALIKYTDQPDANMHLKGRVNFPSREALSLDDIGYPSLPLPTTPTLFFLSHSRYSPWIPIENPLCPHSTAVAGPL